MKNLQHNFDWDTQAFHLTNITTHPYLLLPEFMKNSEYGQCVQQSYVNVYKAIVKHIQLDCIPKEPVLDDSIIKIIEKLLIDTPHEKLSMTIEGHYSNLEKQSSMSLEERLDTFQEAFDNLDNRHSSEKRFFLLNRMVQQYLTVSHNGNIPNNLGFQRSIYKLAFCNNRNAIKNLVATCRNKINYITA